MFDFCHKILVDILELPKRCVTIDKRNIFIVNLLVSLVRRCLFQRKIHRDCTWVIVNGWIRPRPRSPTKFLFYPMGESGDKNDILGERHFYSLFDFKCICGVKPLTKYIQMKRSYSYHKPFFMCSWTGLVDK